jgi:hypothetical protein
MRARIGIVAGLLISISVVLALLPRHESDQRFMNLSRQLNVQIVNGTAFPEQLTSGVINGHAATRDAIERYAPLLEQELRLYPRALFARIGLRRIVLCQGLSFAGQLRGAVPDFGHNTYYLDVSRGIENTTYMRRVLHHDLFHIIDWRDDGVLYGDPQWESLNAPGFHYGSGGKNAQNDSSMSVLTEKLPGFLDRYATTGAEEDKAELFAMMMVDPAYVHRRCEADAVLRAKVQRMRELMRSFCPELR